MSKLQIIPEILNDEFKVEDSKLIEENIDKDKKPFRMEIPIVSTPQIKYHLYRFDPDKKTIFPYFKSVSKLKKICDYILFAEQGKDLYVFPIELKKGTRSSSGTQLKASHAFVNYIIESAKRVGYELDENIHIRTVRICDASKKVTKEKPIEYIDNHTDYKYKNFRLKMLMHY